MNCWIWCYYFTLIDYYCNKWNNWLLLCHKLKSNKLIKIKFKKLKKKVKKVKKKLKKVKKVNKN